MFIMIPLLASFIGLLWMLKNSNRYSDRFKRLYLRFKQQVWPTIIQLSFTKLFFASYLNFYVMQDGSWWEFFTSFAAVYIFLTLVIFMGFYTYIACHCWKVENPGKCKVCCWRACRWVDKRGADRYKDNESRQTHEMTNDWLIEHFMIDINITKPLACFHYVFWMFNRVLMCMFLLYLRNDVYSALMLLMIF